jgi:membrane protease YdiL (CAAX protease family)
VKNVLGSTWRILAFVLTFAVLAAPLPRLAPSQFVIEAATLPLMAFVAFLFGRKLPRSVSSPSRAMAEWGVGIALGLGWIGVTLAGLFAGGVAQVTTQRPELSTVAMLSVMTLVNAASQEVLFRGYPFALVSARHGTFAAIGVSTALFVLLHLGAAVGAPLAFVNLTLAGLLFGFARAVTGRLWLPIGIHFAWNVIIGPVLGLTVSGSKALHAGASAVTLEGSDLFTGASFGVEASLATTITTAILVVLLARRQRSERREPIAAPSPQTA